MKQFTIDVEACRRRQQRLLQVLSEADASGAIVFDNANVQWLTGVYFPPIFVSAAYLSVDGSMTLIAPHKAPPVAAADIVERYDAKFHSTMRNDQFDACVQKLREVGGDFSGSRMGVEYSHFAAHAAVNLTDNILDVEPDLYQLRRKKEPDELALIKHAIDATGLMYEKAREMIVPGVSEIEVFNELQKTAVDYFGEPLTGTGNDYQCCSRGGPPRGGKLANPGELYILDLGPAFRGYFADNARTIAVSKADKNQQTAWDFIMRAFDHVESETRPGKNCRELFEEVQAILDQSPVGVFNHHLGHGIGLFPHEGPHLNPNWNDTFEIGDVFTAEPGLYDPDTLRAGMRIENDYVVTETGVENLTDFDLSL